jgi:hypothetical protein
MGTASWKDSTGIAATRRVCWLVSGEVTMRYGPEQYNEEAELSEYVRRWYGHLFGEDERRGPSVDWLRHAVPQASHRDLDCVFEEEFEEIKDETIRHRLLTAVDRFFDASLQRVLKAHSDQMHIRRCPRCNRIVASPNARQCLWCGFDWH